MVTCGKRIAPTVWHCQKCSCGRLSKLKSWLWPEIADFANVTVPGCEVQGCCLHILKTIKNCVFLTYPIKLNMIFKISQEDAVFFRHKSWSTSRVSAWRLLSEFSWRLTVGNMHKILLSLISPVMVCFFLNRKLHNNYVKCGYSFAFKSENCCFGTVVSFTVSQIHDFSVSFQR